MSETTLGRAKIPIEGDLSKLDKDLSSARGKLESSISDMQKMFKVALAGVIGSAVVGKLADLGKEVAGIVIDAAPVQGLQDAFEGLATSSGKSMDEMLGALQRGSSGMIAQRDLMQAYNKGAQLVSTTFANQLPDAMDYLSKVAAATGQDMGYLLDSLVTGVGRVSPMILDNLGIQVSLSEAVEEWAVTSGKAATKTTDNTAAMAELSEKLSYAHREYGLLAQRQAEAIKGGKEHASIDLQMDKKKSQIMGYTDELNKLKSAHGQTTTDTEALVASMTKAEQQEAVMALTMKKLAENTAAMPDASDSAAAGLARMKATVQDAKDSLGLALQPALAGVMDGVSALAQKFLPLLIDFFEQRVAPVVNKIGEFFKTFAGSLAEGASPADALKTALEAIGLEDVAAKIEDVVDKVIEFRDSVQLLWDKVSDFLKPLSDFISENVILQDVLIALAAIILATVIPAVVSWVVSMGPILLTVAAVIAIVALLRKLCEDDFAILKQAWAAVGQAFEDVGIWIGETVNDIGSWLSKAWNDIKTGAANTWNAITKGITDKVDEIKNKIKDKWSEIKFWLESTMWRIRDNIRDAWDRARQYVVDKVQDMIDRVRNLWSDMKDAGGRLVQGLKDGIQNAWNSFLTWLRGILDRAVDSVKSFFGIHSPSALFAGIGENLMQGLAAGIGDGVTVPVTTMVDAGRDLVDAGSMTMDLRAGQAAGSAGGAQITIYGGLVLHGVQDVPSLLGELQALAV